MYFERFEDASKTPVKESRRSPSKGPLKGRLVGWFGWSVGSPIGWFHLASFRFTAFACLFVFASFGLLHFWFLVNLFVYLGACSLALLSRLFARFAWFVRLFAYFDRFCLFGVCVALLRLLRFVSFVFLCSVSFCFVFVSLASFSFVCFASLCFNLFAYFACWLYIVCGVCYCFV